MGQYHLTVNLDKQEFLDPHVLGTGLKLLEQIGNPGPGLTEALHVLLACSNDRGGGDLSAHPIVGRWAGDRIAVVGDYAERSDIHGCHASLIYEQCRSSYRYSEIESTTLRHVTYDEEFYLQGDRNAGLWRCHDRLRYSYNVLAQNMQTGKTREFPQETQVALLGMDYAEWTDLSWAVARFLEAELDGYFHGTGWRRWAFNAPELTHAV